MEAQAAPAEERSRRDLLQARTDPALPYFLDISQLQDAKELYAGFDVGRRHDLSVLSVVERVAERVRTTARNSVPAAFQKHEEFNAKRHAMWQQLAEQNARAERQRASKQLSLEDELNVPLSEARYLISAIPFNGKHKRLAPTTMMSELRASLPI